jgi:alkylresorcinol/alkylpyrone synthase
MNPAMPKISAVGTALPEHTLRQEDALAHYQRLYTGDLARMLKIVLRSGVEQRHFAFPEGYYLEAHDFERRNADYVAQALVLAERAARAALEIAHLVPEQIDHLILTTTTGLATPSLDALLTNRLGCKRSIRRTPLFGLGCAGGAGAIIRASEALEGHPDQRALVVAVELCGQIFSTRALTPVDVLGAALFGDGAAAVVVSGDRTSDAGPKILGMSSMLFENTEQVMGWRFTSDGMRLVLSEQVPPIVLGPLRQALHSFLRENKFRLGQIDHWVLHPGGKKILDTFAHAFELREEQLVWSRGSLARVGNLSSASVLFVLGDLLTSARPRDGDKGLMAALGPGFAAEMVLLGW